MKLATVTLFAVCTGLSVMAMQYVRPVGAEDDCSATRTVMVERLPAIGLICVELP